VLFAFFVAADADEPTKLNDNIKTNRVRIAYSKELNHKGHEEHEDEVSVRRVRRAVVVKKTGRFRSTAGATIA
jgi:hypothetical protein